VFKYQNALQDMTNESFARIFIISLNYVYKKQSNLPIMQRSVHESTLQFSMQLNRNARKASTNHSLKNTSV